MSDDKKVKHTFLKEDGSIKWSKLIIRTVIMMAFVVAVFVLYEYFFASKGTNDLLAKRLYKELGVHGVAIFVYLVDTFLVPLTVDVIFPLIVDWSPLKIMVVLGTASCLGGFSGYWIGRLISKIKVVHQFVDKIVGSHTVILQHYGALGVVLAAISPIPYSTVCWASGILRIDPRKIILACLVRFPRMILYYYIFIGGLNFFL